MNMLDALNKEMETIKAKRDTVKRDAIETGSHELFTQVQYLYGVEAGLKRAQSFAIKSMTQGGN